MADLTVRIVGDTSKLAGSTRTAEGILARFHGRVSGLGKSLAGGIFGGNLLLAGASAAAAQIGNVFAEARESVRVGRLTDAVLKSTGQAAHVSARQVGELADALAAKTGIDDEAIQGNENLLLTFRSIHNEVGKGNDIFTQASAAVLDMSAALGQDGKASAIQLGKALNDPIVGLTALRRVGVSFTEQQTAQIKAMTKSGNLLGAQKLILKEVGQEFGGAAEAAADPMQKFGVIIKNVEETIGLKLLPIVNKAADWLGKRLPGALDTLGSILSQVFDGGRQLVEDLANTFGTSEGTILKVLGGITIGLIGLAVAWNLGPGVIITGAILLVGALLYAYGHFEGFRAGVQKTMAAVKATVTAVVTAIQAVWAMFGDTIVQYTKGAWASISMIVEGAIRYVRGIIQVVTALIHGDWGKAWDGVKDILAGEWEIIKGLVSGAINTVRFVLAAGWAAIGAGVRAAWEGIVGFFASIPGRIVGAFDGAERWLYNIGVKIITGLLDGLKSALGSVKDFLGDVAGKIVGWKGPPAYDKTILVGNGIEIMRGLHAGLAAGMGLVRSQLKGFTAEIGGSRTINFGATHQAPAAIPFGRAPASAPVYLQVIVDPVTGEQTVRQLQAHQRRNGPLPIKVAG